MFYLICITLCMYGKPTAQERTAIEKMVCCTCRPQKEGTHRVTAGHMEKPLVRQETEGAGNSLDRGC